MIRRSLIVAGVVVFVAVARHAAAVLAPNDVRLEPVTPRASPPPARFSHWVHEARTCMTCHPALFPQSRQGFTHADMRAEKFCGACHNGKSAWDLSSKACETCHAQ
jgi:c(7)-type cytochrome triheme protein